MGQVYYNKLIRDNIPAKMDAKGVTYEVRTMEQDEFELELLKKVGEEASALPKTKDREELVEELADVLDVIDEIRRVKEITLEELNQVQAKNAQKKGGFIKKLFLLWSADSDNYQTNETKQN